MTTPDVLDAVLGHADRRPAAPAISDADRRLSYGDLRTEVGRAAEALRERNVRVGDRVALALPNSTGFAVAALACMWSGAVFVPVSPSDPPARIDSLLADCSPALFVTSSEHHGPLDSIASRSATPTVELDHLVEAAPSPSSAPVEETTPAYMIYTSGTTGRPKGVLVARGPFAAAVDATRAALGLDEATRTLCVSPFHFDGSYATLFPTLVAGGLAVIRPRESLVFVRPFIDTVLREQITYTGFTPSYLRMIATHPQARRLADSPVEVVALGAEPATIADVRAVRELFPRARLFNRYGPTETVIAVSHVLLTDDLVSDGVIPIGRPHPGVTFHIVGEDGSLIESPGVVGELYIGGRQLMTEYWGAPDLSESVLRRDIVPGDVLYRTGDLVYNDEARGLVYVDRSDLVVKRNGVRISLLELRDAIERAPGVSRAACVEFDDSSRVGIAAFAVRSGNVDQSDIAAAIGGIVPSSMLPDRYIFVDAFPLTSSGKLDERQLLADAGLEPRVSAGVVRVTRDVPTRHSSSPREPS